MPHSRQQNIQSTMITSLSADFFQDTILHGLWPAELIGVLSKVQLAAHLKKYAEEKRTYVVVGHWCCRSRCSCLLPQAIAPVLRSLVS